MRERERERQHVQLNALSPFVAAYILELFSTTNSCPEFKLKLHSKTQHTETFLWKKPMMEVFLGRFFGWSSAGKLL